MAGETEKSSSDEENKVKVKWHKKFIQEITAIDTTTSGHYKVIYII